jgi:uncharacterized membrane protein YqjE
MIVTETEWFIILGLSFIALGLCCLALLIIMLIEDRKEEEKWRRKNGKNKTAKD